MSVVEALLRSSQLPSVSFPAKAAVADHREGGGLGQGARAAVGRQPWIAARLFL
jgi:hypothetical protein